MLGKSSDWVSVRSRIHKLPDVLKARLRERPRAVKQFVELGVLYHQNPDLAVDLAERVVRENLTVEAVRARIGEQRKHTDQDDYREEGHNRRAGATSVQNITNALSSAGKMDEHAPDGETDSQLTNAPERSGLRRSGSQLAHEPTERQGAGGPTALTRLQEAVATLASIAARADTLPNELHVEQAIAQGEQALAVLRRALGRPARTTDVDC
jgi:hypothetical protein